MIPTPFGWWRLVRGDIVHLRPPRERPVGEIRYREHSGPLKTARQITAERLAIPLPTFEATKVWEPERVTTVEGEHGAIVRIDGRLGGAPMRRVLGMVFGDHFTAMSDGLSIVEAHFDELEATARDLTQRTMLVLGVRRRRFLYRRPPGWQAVANLFVTKYLAPTFPRDRAMITVYPASPRGETPHQMVKSILEEHEGRGLSTVLIGDAEQTALPNGMTGWRWQISTGPSIVHVAIFEDAKYVYPIRLDDVAGALPENLAAFEALCATIESLAPREHVAVSTVGAREPAIARRDRLAMLGGLTGMHESAPHGTNHASFAYSTAVAATHRFKLIDTFHEDPGLATDRSPGVTIRWRPVRELARETEGYHLVYVSHGDQMGYVAHLLRPHADWAPVVCEIGTSHHTPQWLNMFVALTTGALRPTDAVIFAGTATRDLHVRVWEQWQARFGALPIPKTTVMTNAVDVDAHRHRSDLRITTRERLGVAATDVVFASFGRLCEFTKGDQVAIVALWREIAARAPMAVLVFAGTWDTRVHVDNLRRMARQVGIGNRVIIVEDPYQAMPNARTSLMSAADVALHLTTGIEETSSLVVLEAKAHGLPVIAAKWSGVAELVRHDDDGLLVDVWNVPVAEDLRITTFGRDGIAHGGEATRSASCDPRQIIEAVVALATDHERRRRLATRALSAVRERGSLTDAARRRVAYFDEIVEAARDVPVPPPPRPFVDIDDVVRSLASRPVDDRIKVTLATREGIALIPESKDLDFRALVETTADVLAAHGTSTVGELAARVRERSQIVAPRLHAALARLLAYHVVDFD